MISSVGFTNAVSSAGGGSATLTVVNNSSVDRQQNEKVWIRQIVGGWEIIDWALADVNSLTAKCDSTIAVGGTGTVSLADDGQVMQHLVRNFTLGAGTQESEINDASKLFTYNAYYASASSVKKYLVSGKLDLPATQLKDLLLKVTFKFSPVDPDAGLTASSIGGVLLSTTYSNNTSFPTSNDYSYYPHIYASSNDSKIRSEYYYNGYSYTISLSYGSVIDFDKWITATLRFNNTSPKARFDISDNIGNSDYGTENYVAGSEGNIQRAFIGTKDRITYQINTTIDLAKTGLYTADGSTTLWEPYKQSVV